nr:hypothetical protein [Tanacetum cinerariifolium]
MASSSSKSSSTKDDVLHGRGVSLNVTITDKPKDNTLTGSVPDQDEASRGKWGVFSLRDWHRFSDDKD